jgi:LPS export ABC transporter protein LptC
MNKRNSIILGLLFGIIGLEILVLAPKDVGLLPSSEDVSHVGATGAIGDDSTSSQLMQDVHLIETNASGKDWELWANRAIRPQEQGEWMIEKVKVKFFATGGVTYTVTGLKGNVVPTKNDIRISGQVVTHSSNGYVFKTESVFYDAKNRRLTSPGLVEMHSEGRQEGDDFSLTGTEMVAELGTNEIKINRHVHAKRRIKTDKFATIRSERALVSGSSNRAHFFGNVVIDFDTMRITGPEAKFVYDRDTQAFESMDIVGGARLSDLDRIATSGSVSVHFAEDRIVFKGGPRIMQNGDELVGDEIVFLDGGRKVKVSNAKAQFDPKAMENRN